jgi:hypothetical protein
MKPDELGTVILKLDGKWNHEVDQIALVSAW